MALLRSTDCRFGRKDTQSTLYCVEVIGKAVWWSHYLYRFAESRREQQWKNTYVASRRRKELMEEVDAQIAKEIGHESPKTTKKHYILRKDQER